MKRYPLTPTTLSQSSNHVFFFAGRWSTSGWGGNAHFFTYTRIRSRETGENRRINEQTKLGVTKGRGRCCNTICMCRLSLAWVTSENSTMLLESDILRLFFTGPYLVSPPLCSVSGVDCPFVDPRQLPLLLSNYQLSLGLLPPTAHCVYWSLPLSGSRRQLSFASLYHFRIRRDFRSKNPLSGFAPKQTRLLWRPAPIVLQKVATFFFQIRLFLIIAWTKIV